MPRIERAPNSEAASKYQQIAKRLCSMSNCGYVPYPFTRDSLQAGRA
ncbi:hypothetical protein SAMCCGM7_pC1273 (plasmid) [Sinorhizobium americanum CCGM7]|nr:hypothetical protein [Sinorhizobium americanum]APG88465.1 hypothetical protein SAMCCGM7_pC1273 [Sinorhizobium americanum CCGM7]